MNNNLDPIQRLVKRAALYSAYDLLKGSIMRKNAKSKFIIIFARLKEQIL